MTGCHPVILGGSTNSISKDMNHLMTFSGQDLTGLSSHFSAQHTFMVTWRDLTMSYSLQRNLVLDPCFCEISLLLSTFNHFPCLLPAPVRSCCTNSSFVTIRRLQHSGTMFYIHYDVSSNSMSFTC